MGHAVLMNKKKVLIQQIEQEVVVMTEKKKTKKYGDPKSFGIDVILIEPGVIKTEFQDVMMDSTVKRSIGTPYEKKLKALETPVLDVDYVNLIR